MSTSLIASRRLTSGILTLILFLATCAAGRAQEPAAKNADGSIKETPYYQTYYGFTGIHAAAAQNSVEHLKELLDADTNLISARNMAGRTPLCIAAMRGDTEAVEYLISRGADVNDKGFYGLTPLADMAMYGTTNDEKCVEIAGILVAHGATVDAFDDYPNKRTPLLHAIEMNKNRLARFLLSQGADTAVTFGGVYDRVTPLQYELKHGNFEMATEILEHKPPLEWMDTDGATPLMWAVKSGKLEAARMLLEHGASTTPTFTRESAQMAPALYHFVTNNSHGYTPLHWAVIHEDKKMVALLLQFKAPVYVKDEAGETPLDMAKIKDKTELIALLSNAAASGQKPSPDETTPDVPSREYMKSLAYRVAAGDAAAFDDFTKIADDMYQGMDYRNPDDRRRHKVRARLNGDRLRVAFQVLGDEAASGNEKALEALKKSLKQPNLQSMVPQALGTAVTAGNEKAFEALKELLIDRRLKDAVPGALAPAAAAGNKEALEILLHCKDWGILYTSADMALEKSAEANLEPAIDYFTEVLSNPTNAAHGRYGAATRALKSAADKGNQKAKDALAKFDASPGPHF